MSLADHDLDVPSVRLDRHDDVAVVTFSSSKLNLYSLALHEQFDRRLDELSADPARAVIVRASGRVVSAGVDVSEFYARKSQESTKALYDRMIELPQRIAALDVPTVFAAHSLTLTWALEVALACDLLVATPSASFGLVERVVGLTPTMGGTQRLAARAGVARAKQVVLSGRQFDAATFERWNIVNEVVEEDVFDEAVLSLAQDLAAGPTRAFAATKAVLNVYEASTVGRANAEVTSIASELFATDDLQHGMHSFLTDGPGKATFTGR